MSDKEYDLMDMSDSTSSLSIKKASQDSGNLPQPGDTPLGVGCFQCSCLQSDPGSNVDANPDAPDIDALHTPIPVPLPSTLQSNQSYQDASSPARTLTDYEEIASDAFVHAACRVHEATMLAKAACNELVFWSSGMKPQEAVNAAKAKPEEKNKFVEQMKGKKEQDNRRGNVLVVQAALMATLSNAAAAGVMAGMAMDARSMGVSHGYLNPLAALSTSTTAPNTETAASTFASLTGGAASSTDLTALRRHLAEMARLNFGVRIGCYGNLASPSRDIEKMVEGMAFFLKPGHVPTFVSNTKHYLQLMVEEIRREMADETLQEAVKSIMKMLEAFLDRLCAAAKTTEILVAMATVHAKETRRKEETVPWSTVRYGPGRIAARVVRWMRGTTDDTPLVQQCHDAAMKDAVQDLLQQAQKACEQSLAAVKAARAHVTSAAANATSGTMQPVWEAAMH